MRKIWRKEEKRNGEKGKSEGVRRYKLWEDCQYCSKGDRDRPYQTFPSIFIIGSECSPVAIGGAIGVGIHSHLS